MKTDTSGRAARSTAPQQHGPRAADTLPPPSSRRRLTPLHPITATAGRGLMPSSRRRSSVPAVWAPQPPSLREILLPMTAAFLCAGFFWLVAVVKTVGW
jgi:hypothetical protein